MVVQYGALPGTTQLVRSHAVDTGARRARPPEEFAGVLERGPDTGLIPPGVALSPSQADLYLDCPRRYAFERRLRVGAEGSVYTSLGSLVHEVLEEVEGAALTAGEAHGTLPSALEALERRWDPAPFGGGAWAEAWQRRAQEALRHLYVAREATSVVLLTVHNLNFFLSLMRGAREAIIAGRYSRFRTRVELARMAEADEDVSADAER